MAEFYSKDVIIKTKKVKVQIWDTAGQELFKSISETLYKNKDGFLLIYDITKRKSFEGLNHWIEQINNNSIKDVPIILLGNKSDLNSTREVSTEEGEKLAQEKGYNFLETSALTNENECIDTGFRILIESFLIRNFRKKY